MKFNFDKTAGRPKKKTPIPNMRPFEEIKERAQEIKPHEINQFRKKLDTLVKNQTPIVDEKLMEDIYTLRELLRRYTFNPFDEGNATTEQEQETK